MVHVDLVFMGVHGMDEASGFTSPNLLEAETDRTLIAAGRRLVVVADHTKWGIVGLSTIAQLDEADVLITDSGLPTDARETIRAHVRELMLVGPAGAVPSLQVVATEGGPQRLDGTDGSTPS
jgi:DeoR/GlpR family transcriptional regulator of sugar metabolism